MDSRPWTRHYDYSVPETLRPPRLGVHELLGLPANTRPDKAALIYHGKETSFYQLRRQVQCFALALEELGVEKGDRVGLQLPTSPAYVIAYYAVLSLGAIVTNLNPLSPVPELEYAIAHTGTGSLITIEQNREQAKALFDAGAIERVILARLPSFVTEEAGTIPDLPSDWHDFSVLLAREGRPHWPKVEIVPEDPAQIQFTGGTTGVPKGATLTHANVVAAALACKHWGSGITSMQPPEAQNVLAVLPYYHVYGNIVVMTSAVLAGNTQILVDRFDPDSLMELISRCDQIGFFPAVPTLIAAVIHHPRAEELRLDHRLGLLNSGGAPMPASLIEKIEELGIPYGEGWGMSETSSMGIANPVLGRAKVGSVGVPLPGMEVRLVNVEDGGAEVAVGEPGELIVRGPLVMRGYWDDEAKTADQIRDGWLHTGDIAVRDEDDYFFLVDRKKDMIITGGFNVYPREVDEVLYRHPKILEAVTIGVPDDYRGEAVKAFVVTAPGEELSAQEVTDFCRENLVPYKVPRQVEFRDSLPKSAVGKILRKDLRREEEERRGARA